MFYLSTKLIGWSGRDDNWLFYNFIGATPFLILLLVFNVVPCLSIILSLIHLLLGMIIPIALVGLVDITLCPFIWIVNKAKSAIDKTKHLINRMGKLNNKQRKILNGIKL